MKSILRLFCNGFLGILLLSSCSIQTRYHNSGFHVEWKQKNHLNPKDVSIREGKEKISVYYTEDLTMEKVYVDRETVFFEINDQALMTSEDTVCIIIPERNFRHIDVKMNNEIQATKKKIDQDSSAKYSAESIISYISGIVSLSSVSAFSVFGEYMIAEFVFLPMAAIFGILALIMRRRSIKKNLPGKEITPIGIIYGLYSVIFAGSILLSGLFMSEFFALVYVTILELIFP